MTTTDKTKLIENILKLTKKEGQVKYFDKLHGQTEEYLRKHLKTCKNLKKVK